jgi:hypothetical protein
LDLHFEDEGRDGETPETVLANDHCAFISAAGGNGGKKRYMVEKEESL